MTNTFEGSIFVSSTIEANQTVTDYVTQLMPQFNEKQIQEAVKTYTGIGLDTVFDQAVGIMGECKLHYGETFLNIYLTFHKAIFICPTYLLLDAFPGRSHKVRTSENFCTALH